MIRVTDYNNLMEQMVAAIPALSGLVVVGNEKHLVRKLNDKSGLQLGAVIPSADPAGDNEDSVAENNIFFLFFLEKVDPGAFTDSEELQHYQKMQDATTEAKNWLRDEKLGGNPFLEHLNLNSIHTDPEYQFGGWNGWSINGNFDTNGY